MKKKILFAVLALTLLVTGIAWATSSTLSSYSISTTASVHDVRTLTQSAVTVIGTGADTSSAFDVDAYTLFGLSTKTSKCLSGDTVRVSWYVIYSLDGANWSMADSLVRVTNDTTYKVSKFSNASGVASLSAKLITQGRAGNDTTTTAVKLIMQK